MWKGELQEAESSDRGLAAQWVGLFSEHDVVPRLGPLVEPGGMPRLGPLVEPDGVQSCIDT